MRQSVYVKSPLNELPDWQSPARFLASWLCGLPAAAAPEKQTRLASLIDEVELIVLDDGEWILEYRRHGADGKAQIRVSRKVLEIVWASCCAYFVYYKRVFEQTPPGTRPIVELDSDPEAEVATRLLIWAHEEFKDSTDREWPVASPRPCENPPPDSFEYQVTQFYAMVMSFMLHHEIAHHRLGHLGSNVESENDADREAAEWLLGGLNELDLIFMFRSWGVAAGLGVLTARAIHNGQFNSNTHPRSFDRLWSVLHHHVKESHHPAWQMAVIVLHLHLALASREVPDASTFADAFSAVDRYVDYLAEFAARER